ncbi:MAG: hypothetical protein EHM61_00430 [Acidobacteria bacterium]|nr:MAG: hypothetical protein EHM61_00430 [Acidobacteriota bacterium]
MLKIMTLNLNYLVDKHGAWPERRGLIARTIEQNGPDIIAFQAVRAMGGGLTQIEELSRLVSGYPYRVFIAAVEHGDGTADGSAFLSRVPSSSVDSLRLSLPDDPDDPTPRVLLHGVFVLQQGILDLLNCHFSWISPQAVRSVSEVLPYVGGINGPVMLVGDMNSTPETEAMKKLAQAGFIDVWSELHPGDTGFTFEADNPSIRIDYAWINPLLQPLLKGIEQVGELSPHPPRLSDHLGLVVTLELAA